MWSCRSFFFLNGWHVALHTPNTGVTKTVVCRTLLNIYQERIHGWLLCTKNEWQIAFVVYIYLRPNFPTQKQPWYVPTGRAEIGKNGNKMNPLLFVFVLICTPPPPSSLESNFFFAQGGFYGNYPRNGRQCRKGKWRQQETDCQSLQP